MKNIFTVKGLLKIAAGVTAACAINYLINKTAQKWAESMIEEDETTEVKEVAEVEEVSDDASEEVSNESSLKDDVKEILTELKDEEELEEKILELKLVSAKAINKLISETAKDGIWNTAKADEYSKKSKMIMKDVDDLLSNENISVSKVGLLINNINLILLEMDFAD